MKKSFVLFFLFNMSLSLFSQELEMVTENIHHSPPLKALGASVEVPFKRGSEQMLGIDYGYRATDPYDGTHNVSLRLAF